MKPPDSYRFCVGISFAHKYDNPSKDNKLHMDNKLRIVTALILTAIFSLAGCGGGGGDVGTAFPPKTLSWAPPSAYTDSTPLNPSGDLDVFEIYVKTSESFSATDSPMAALKVLDPGTGQLNTSFNLANLGPYFSKGVTYFISVRTVAKNSLKSDFANPVSFSF